MAEITECDHLWVRRRDGSWCADCGEQRFGVTLSQEELERLRKKRDVKTKTGDGGRCANIVKT